MAGSDDQLRRYRLARMDELALATPPDPSALERETRQRAAFAGERGAEDAATPAGARRAGRA